MICRLIGIGSKIYHHNAEILGLEMLLASLKSKRINGELVYYEYDSNETISDFCHKYKWDEVVLVGFSPFYTTFDIVADFMVELKKLNSSLLFCAGGVAVSHAAKEALEYLKDIDLIIRGEGELTLCELMFRILQKRDWRKCLGITYRENGQIVTNKSRNPIEDLDQLPWAERVMLKHYHGSKVRIQTARGCEGHCTFCAESRVFDLDAGKTSWRGRTAKNIVDEIENIVAQHAINFFSIVDESYEDPASGIGFKRIENISDEILARGLDVYYEVMMRSENVLKIPISVWDKMKKSGLVGVLLGIESGSNNALKTYGKIATVNENIEAYNFLYEQLGINVIAGFIMFNPYSTINEYYENVDFVKKMGLEYSFRVFSNKVHLYYGTPLYKRAERDLLLKKQYGIIHPMEYKFASDEIERLSEDIDSIIQLVDKDGMGEYVTDYYHDTYERIVMHEKTDKSELTVKLKKEMKDLRKEMGQYVTEIFSYAGKKIDQVAEKRMLYVMDKYKSNTIQKCNRILRELLKSSGDMSRGK